MEKENRSSADAGQLQEGKGTAHALWRAQRASPVSHSGIENLVAQVLDHFRHELFLHSRKLEIRVILRGGGELLLPLLVGLCP